MALEQFVKLDTLQPANIGFYYEGIPEAGVTLGVFEYPHDVVINLAECTLNADEDPVYQPKVYLTLEDIVIATGQFFGVRAGNYTFTTTLVSVSANQTVRLVAPTEMPAEETISGIRSTIVATRKDASLF